GKPGTEDAHGKVGTSARRAGAGGLRRNAGRRPGRRRLPLESGAHPRAVRGRRADRWGRAHPCGSPVGALGRQVGGGRRPGRPPRWGGRSGVVEERPGAGTIVATAATAKATPDGYTLGIATNAFLINPAIGMKLPYDTRKDFSSVTMIATQPVALVANAAYPA